MSPRAPRPRPLGWLWVTECPDRGTALVAGRGNVMANVAGLVDGGAVWSPTDNAWEVPLSEVAALRTWCDRLGVACLVRPPAREST